MNKIVATVAVAAAVVLGGFTVAQAASDAPEQGTVVAGNSWT